MSSAIQSFSEDWLLVQLISGGSDVVYVKSVVSPVSNQLKIGDRLIVTRRGEQEGAILIARAREREMLDGMVKKMEVVAGPSHPRDPEDEDKDFSSSASEWVPSDDDASDDSATEAKTKKIKLEHYKRQYSTSSKNILTPSNKANAVINMMNRKKSHDDSKIKDLTIKKSLPDSTKMIQKNRPKITIDIQKLRQIKNIFKLMFDTIDNIKNRWHMEDQKQTQSVVPALNIDNSVQNSNSEITNTANTDDSKENKNDRSENDEFNRSDDNVLISNKYNVGVKNVTGNEEFVAIGSGKTFIHKDKFRKVNWKSYTIATRTLLLAVFPRRILATHSLTGKKSPAFQNKPAKMCLDPKIISDVIIEVMDRFRVKENLVRSIITTKCADECKMWKTRNKKKSATAKNEKTAV